MAKKALNKEGAQPVNEKTVNNLSYEDLQRIAMQLRSDNNYLNERCAQAENVIAEFNEIGMLLSILERSECFDASFTQRCAARIQRLVSEAMDIAEEREAQEKAARKEVAPNTQN